MVTSSSRSTLPPPSPPSPSAPAAALGMPGTCAAFVCAERAFFPSLFSEVSYLWQSNRDCLESVRYVCNLAFRPPTPDNLSQTRWTFLQMQNVFDFRKASGGRRILRKSQSFVGPSPNKTLVSSRKSCKKSQIYCME